MLTIMQKEVKLIFNASQIYIAKKNVFKMTSGSDIKQYAMLWSYAEEIKNSNPGIAVKIKCKQLRFKKVLCMLGALKMGFLRVIGQSYVLMVVT